MNWKSSLLQTEGLWRALTRRDGLFLIAGPCVIESDRHPHQVAARLKAITRHLGIPWIFKASYDKANRSSHGSYRGPGMSRGLEILEENCRYCHEPLVTAIDATSKDGRTTVSCVRCHRGVGHGDVAAESAIEVVGPVGGEAARRVRDARAGGRHAVVEGEAVDEGF